MFKYQLIILIIIGLIYDVRAQHAPYKHFTTAEGLPSTGIYNVFQDSEGYIWLGTKAGAVQFDGRNFQCFSQADGLPSSFVYGFKEDSRERIWPLSSIPQPIYYHNDKWYKHPLLPQSSIVNRKGFLNSIVEDDHGNIFLGCHGDEIIKINSTNIATSIRLKTNTGLKKIIKHKQDSFIVITKNEIISYSNAFQTTNWSYRVKGQEILRCKQICQNILFIVTTHHNLFFSIDKRAIINSHPNTKQPEIIFIGAESDNGVLVGTRNGLYYANHDSLIVHPYNKWLTGKAISSILFDREGGIWFSTLESGLFYFPKFPFNLNEAVKNEHFSTYEIDTNTDSLYFIGMNNGHYGFWDRKKEDIVLIDSVPFSNKIHSFFDFGKNEKWIFTDASLQLQLANNRKYSIKYGSRDVVFHQKSNSFIFTHMDGVFAIKRDYLLKKAQISNPEILIIQKEEDFTLRQISNIGHHQLVLHDDELWMVGLNGLSKYSFNTESLENLSKKHDFIPTELSSIAVIDQNLIALGTYGQGVIIWNVKDNTFSQISRDQGLNNDYSKNLYLADSASLWVAHLEGISKISIIELSNISVCNYGFPDGLLLGEYNVISQDKNNLYIGTSNGIASAPRAALDAKRTTPEITIKKIIIDNKEANLPPHGETAKKSMIEELSISFSCINFIYGEDIKILYRLKGRDKSWQQVLGNEVQFSNLSPNKYHFEIKAVHPLGFESDTVSIPIAVYKPFYNTLWFRLLTLLAIIGGVIRLFQLKILSFDIENITAVFHNMLNIEHKAPPKLTLKTVDGIYHKLPLEDILYIQATGNYTKIICIQRTLLARNTLKNLERELTGQKEFQKIHRSFIINLEKVEKIMPGKIHIGSAEIPYSKSYKDAIEALKQKIQVA